jgi:CRP/FNR family transcriptional regulator
MSAMTAERRTQLLCHVFPSLCTKTAHQLSERCIDTQYRADELVAQEGSFASGVYIVESGLIKIGKYGDRDGEKRVLRFLGVGEIFGLEALILGHSTHFEYAKTLLPTTLLFVDRGTLLEFKDRQPELCSDFCRWLAREVVMLEFKLSRDSVGSLDRNLALLLLALAHNYGIREKEGLAIDVPVTRRVMADMLGVSVESLLRALRRFRQRGELATRGRRIVLADLERLQERARTTPFYLSIIRETL